MREQLTKARVEALAREMDAEMAADEVVSKIDAIAALRPVIDRKRQAGVSLPTICQWLSSKGLVISPGLLSQYLRKLAPSSDTAATQAFSVSAAQKRGEGKSKPTFVPKTLPGDL